MDSTILRLLSEIFQLPRGFIGRTGPGPGVARAEARLVEHRKKFDGIDKTPNPTRQQQRHIMRWQAKVERSTMKNVAMRRKLPGGAAAVV
jgi:hypothetical protein